MVNKTSIQDFNNLVGIREQDESVKNSLRLRISLREERSKLDNNGGLGIFGGTTVSELLPVDGHSLIIFSSKKLRKK